MQQSIFKLSFRMTRDSGQVCPPHPAAQEWPDLFLPPYLSLSMALLEKTPQADDWESYIVTAWYEEKPDLTAIEKAAQQCGVRVDALKLDAEHYDYHQTLDDNYLAQEGREILSLKYLDIRRSKAEAPESPMQQMQQNGRASLNLWAPQAFGDGFHPTTRLCLKILEGLFDKGDEALPVKERFNFLDAGTGSGILSLVVHCFWAAHIVATDCEEEAIQTLQDNWRRHHFPDEELQPLCCAHLDHADIKQNAPFVLACANMVKAPLCDLMPQIAQMQQNGHIFIISGYTTQQREDIEAFAETLGYAITRRLSQDGWEAALSHKQG